MARILFRLIINSKFKYNSYENIKDHNDLDVDIYY